MPRLRITEGEVVALLKRVWKRVVAVYRWLLAPSATEMRIDRSRAKKVAVNPDAGITQAQSGVLGAGTISSDAGG